MSILEYPQVERLIRWPTYSEKEYFRSNILREDVDHCPGWRHPCGLGKCGAHRRLAAPLTRAGGRVPERGRAALVRPGAGSSDDTAPSARHVTLTWGYSGADMQHAEVDIDA